MVHPVFHVSQLKNHVPDHTPVFSSLPTIVDFYSQDLAPELILDRRLVKKGNAARLQVLIPWTSLPTSADTWDDYEWLKLCFPHTPAWEQAGSQGGGTVSTLDLALTSSVPGKRKLKKRHGIQSKAF